MKTVFTTGEAAKICKVSQQTIIRCFDNGQLKGFRVPGSKFRRIPREALYKFMKDNGIPTEALESGKRKVLAFLAAAFEKEHDYVPAGTYGVKISADGGTLYVNFNGHAGEKTRPKAMKPNGFGLCGFVAIHIPASER